MVLLSGPRQVGKTTLSKSILQKQAGLYLNYDVIADRRQILDQSWEKSAPLLVFDEIHKFKKWKNFLKGIYDSRVLNQSILVTGSARFDHFRKSGDALTGRYFHDHLHPIDLKEGSVFMPDLPPKGLAQYLLRNGGFPESFFHPEDSARLAKSRIEQLLSEDVRDLSRIGDIKALELMIAILRENNGGSLNYDSLARQVGISPPTAKSWVLLLEKLYVIFLVTPFSSNIQKAARKEAKFYFYDLSLNLNESSFALENLVALQLLKHCDFQNDVHGKNLQLHYYKDANRHEVDFVITQNRKPVDLIEVKTSDHSVSRNLLFLAARFPQAKAIQLVFDFDRVFEKSGIRVDNLSEWLVNLG